MIIRISLVCLACCTALIGQAAAQIPRDEQQWTYYRNERFGFSLRYPADVFDPEKASKAGDGQVFVARDGEARLLVGALPNDKGQSPGAYQAYIARESYADYRIGYRRLAGSWFVLSGEGNGKTFYEKVMFSCGGRMINSFAMIYPTDQRRIFDPIVEGIKASFRPARDCGRLAASRPGPFPATGTRSIEGAASGPPPHWLIGSRDREGTTSSSSRGDRGRPMITRSFGATRRANGSSVQH